MVKSKDKTPRKRAIKLKAPPFSSPAKDKAVKLPKKEKSATPSHTMHFQRVGDKKNSYIIYCSRPSGEASYMHPIDVIVTSDTTEGENFRTYINALAPLVSRRKSRDDNRPMREKFPDNLRAGATNFPFRCLYCEKTDEIEHETYILYVMNLVKDVITENSRYKNDYIVNINASDQTVDGPRPLDTVITDKGIQTILYRYYYAEHLTEENFNEDTKTYEIPSKVTTTFFDEHANVAQNFFSPHNGKYSQTAQSFGFPETEYSTE